MPKKIIQSWFAGFFVFSLLLAVGSAMNFRTQEVAKPACQNIQFVDYLGCDGFNISSTKHYVTGWPHKAYCYSDGKDSCTSEADFLYIPRNNERNDIWKENIIYIGLMSVVSGLLVTSLLLTKAQPWKKHENTRD